MSVCCCAAPDCGLCNVRSLADTSHNWSGNILNSASCNATVIDMAVLPGVGLYVLGRKNGGRYVVQRWPEAGSTRVNSVDLPASFSGLRIDGSPTSTDRVFVCGLATTGQPNVYALDAISLATVWSVDDGGASGSLSFSAAWDVEPDGTGGVYVARTGAQTSVNCDDTGDGYVSLYGSTGTLLGRFGGHNNGTTGPPTARSLLYDGTHLFVGSTIWETPCLCTGVTIPQTAASYFGHLARFTGESLDWLTGYNLDMPNDGYPNRLAMSSDFMEEVEDRGRLFAGYYDGENGCNIVEWNPETGEQIAPYELDPAPTVAPALPAGFEIVNALGIGVGQLSTPNLRALKFVAGGLIWETDLEGGNEVVRSHSGADNVPATVLGDYYALAVSVGDPNADPDPIDDALYVGGTTAGCADDSSDTETGTMDPCTTDWQCECGDHNPSGEAIVDCPCDDGVPCPGSLLQMFDGCPGLEEYNGTAALTYSDGTGFPFGGQNHYWFGSRDETPDGCGGAIRLTAYVGFTCPGTWKLVYQIRAVADLGTVVAQFEVDIVDQGCTDGEHDSPWFEFQWDGTVDSGSLPGCFGDCDPCACGGLGMESCECAGGPIDCAACPETFSVAVGSGTATITRAMGFPCQWNGSLSGDDCRTPPFDNNIGFAISGTKGTLTVGGDVFELDPFDCDGLNTLTLVFDFLGCGDATATVQP